jgi:hypothetical protein
VGDGYHGAVEVEWFETLEEIVDGSTAVIVGTVLGHGPKRTIVGDAEGDLLDLPSLEVRVDRLLAGSLSEGGIGDSIVLQTLRVPSEDRLPRGPAVFFVRYMLEDAARLGAEPAPGDEGRYRLVSSQGLMIADVDGRVRLAVFEAAYSDVIGEEEWAGSELTRLLEAVGGSRIDDLLLEIETLGSRP